MEEKPLAGTTGVIYCRRSTGSKAQKETSLIEQKRICTRMAEELGIELPYEVFAEQCNSSSTPHKFNLLKDKVVKGEIEVDFILIEKEDRFKREYVDSKKENLQPLQDRNVQRIHAIGSGAMVPHRLIAIESDSTAKIIEVVETNKNADYVADLAERLSHRVYEKATNGGVVSKKAFGWKTLREFDEGGHCTYRQTIPDPEEAPLVVEMFDKFLATEKLADLIPILEKHKSYPKKRCLKCKKRLGSTRGLAVSADTEICHSEIEDVENETVSKCGGTEFEIAPIGTPTIRSILRNAYHAGRYTYFKSPSGKWRTRKNGKVVDVKMMKSLNQKLERDQNINPKDSEIYIEEHHEGIVDPVVFDKVQDILDKNKTDNSCKGPKAKGVYTGRVKCGTCGSNMTFGSTQGRTKYTCNNSKRSNTKVMCGGGTKTIRQDDLEQIVLDGVVEVLESPEFWMVKLKELNELVEQREKIRLKNDGNSDVQMLRDKIATLDEIIENTDYTDAIAVFQQRKIVEQKLNLEKDLSRLVSEEQKYLENPVVQMFDQLKDGRRYEELVAEFSLSESFSLMGVHREIIDRQVVWEEVKADSDLAKFSMFYVMGDSGETAMFELEKMELFSELIAGNYWGLVCAGYLLKTTGLDDFQIAILLAQSYKRWEIDSDSLFWSEILDEVVLNYVSVDEVDDYPLAKRLVLKNQKQVCGFADVTVGGVVWQNDRCGATTSVTPHSAVLSTTPPVTIRVH